MNIYLVRHGEAAEHWHKADDPGLSELGHQQAAEIAKKYRKYKPPFDWKTTPPPRTKPAISRPDVVHLI